MKIDRSMKLIGGVILPAALALAQWAPVAPPAPPAPRVAPAPAAPRAMLPAGSWEPTTPPAAPMAMMPAAAWDQVAPAPAAPRAMLPAGSWEPTTPPAAPMAMMPAAAWDQVAPVPPVPPVAPVAPTPAAMPAWPNVDPQAILDDVRVQLDGLTLSSAYQQDAMLAAQDAMAQVNANISNRINTTIDGRLMQARVMTKPGGSEDGMYNNGLQAINNHQYDQALSEFNNVVARNGSRTEGALYWKAYVLNKLGRAADAQASIDTLRKTYPSSRWLEDSKALELEVKQSKGPVSAEAETDEDIKVIALNGLMQSDPEKALPQIENLLKGSHSPKLKRQALYVIAQSSLPKAQQDLEQIARGSNPDVQVYAIQYLAQKRNPNTPQVLLEIYTSSNDPAVKRAILDAFSGARDKDRLLQIARTDKDGAMHTQVIQRLGTVDGQPELWQIYQAETTPEGKIAVLDAMYHNGNLDKLTEVARTDKDPKVRQRAIQVIARQDAGSPSSTLATLYKSEQDEKVKQTIIDNLSNSRNCGPLVEVAKSEKDLKLKLRVVERLSGMTKSCPAATDYLTELLNK